MRGFSSRLIRAHSGDGRKGLTLFLTIVVALATFADPVVAAPKTQERCAPLDGQYDVALGWANGVAAPGIAVVSASDEQVVFELADWFSLTSVCVKTGNHLNGHNIDTSLPASGPKQITISKSGPGGGIGQVSFDTEATRFDDTCWNNVQPQGDAESASSTATLPFTPGGGTSAAQILDSPPVITSANVNYHGTIPLDSPGVGGRVVERPDLGGKKFFYVTGLKGLSVYDITRPDVPILAGHLPFAHAQNEDVKVSEDGKTVMIAADGSLLVPINPVTTGITLIDVTNPALPEIVASSNDRVMRRGTATGISEHTAECANADCSVIYGRTGRIYQADRTTGRVDAVGFWNRDIAGQNVGGIHALNRDETGLVISDSNPRLVLDPGVLDPTATPLAPKVLAQGARSPQDNRLQHNNVRTDAAAWEPRPSSQEPTTAIRGQDFEVSPRAISVHDTRTFLCPGELVIGNSESNLNQMCSNAGGLSTWSIQNFEREDVSEIRQLEVFKPLNGTWTDGSPRANALGCSGHWFTENDGIVAASWYEHGVHFFDIDKRFGTITEVGYFQPAITEAGAAHWVDDNFVYSVDYARGIDILSFDRGAQAPSQRELDQAWIQNLDRTGKGALATQERYLCKVAARRIR